MAEISDLEREEISCEEDGSYIYGHEMIASLATIFRLCEHLRNKNVTLYIDNRNARDALVKGHSKTVVINRTIQIFWPFAQAYGRSLWLELIPTGRNISDLPARYAPLPVKCREYLPFGTPLN